MKIKIPLSRNRKPEFAGVARIIAEGELPEWLLQGLDHFSGGIGTDASKERKTLEKERITRAVDVLMKRLPIFQRLSFGLECTDYVTSVLGALPRIKKDLDRLSGVRSRSITRHEMCAAVVVEAWKLLHGKVEPRSEKLLEACNEYWVACGGKQRGETDDIENWRRPVVSALATDHEWARAVLQALQNELTN
jgi:hypothetical protein